jgi:copper chaperone CopZ
MALKPYFGSSWNGGCLEMSVKVFTEERSLELQAHANHIVTEILEIEGMECDFCVFAVAQALEAIHGVKVRNVTLGRAEIEVDRTRVGPAAIASAIFGAGFLIADDD